MSPGNGISEGYEVVKKGNSMKRIRIYYDPRCVKHLGTGGYAEIPERLTAIREGIQASSLLEDVEIATANPCQISELMLAHDKEYIESLEDFCNNEEFIPSAEIQVNLDSWLALRLTVGAGIDAVDSIILDEIDAAFIAMRPPGHHAERNQALGFCLVNNVAITAEYAKSKGIEKILILDWDVHHGNGTQHIFWDDPNVLFISIHQEKIYPFMDDEPHHRGGEKAWDKTLNIPLVAGSNGNVLRSIWNKKIKIAVESFVPNLIIISAGFDAHKSDPLASLRFETNDYGWMTAQVNQWAEQFNCKIVSYLEGGYNLEALSDSVVVHCETLKLGSTKWIY